jgi:hypothetical protein
MPTVITCPSCQKQLRLPDDLLGRPVQCPRCSETFEPGAKTAPTPPPSSRPVDSSPPPSSPPASGPFGFDLKLSLDDSASPAPRPQPLSDPAARETSETIPPWRPRPDPVDEPTPRRAPASQGQDRKPADERDQGRRPERVPQRESGQEREKDRGRDAERGWDRDKESDGDGDRPRSWRNRNDDSRIPDQEMPRRDAVPHRGGTILTLGVVGLSLILLSWLFVPIPVSLVLGLCAWVMGASDLRKMKAGEMDVDGRSNTQAGYVCGILATLLAALIALSCAGFISFLFFMDPRNTGSARPRYGAPASPTRKTVPNPNQQDPVEKKGQEEGP